MYFLFLFLPVFLKFNRGGGGDDSKVDTWKKGPYSEILPMSFLNPEYEKRGPLI